PATGSLTVSQITLETRNYTAGVAPGSTAAAITAFNNAPTNVAGYSNAPVSVPSFAGLSNHGTIGGQFSNNAYHVPINVTTTGSAPLTVRVGGDFGYGATLTADGVVLQERWADMFWGGSWSNATQYLQGTTTFAPGTHVIDVYGFDPCCDG